MTYKDTFDKQNPLTYIAAVASNVDIYRVCRNFNFRPGTTFGRSSDRDVQLGEKPSALALRGGASTIRGAVWVPQGFVGEFFMMKRRWAGLQAVRLTPEDSSAEVTSSSTTLVMSPANSLASTDIGEVDLEFWDLDISGQNHARNLIIQNGYGAISGHTIIAKSDTSSMSGTSIFFFPK